MKIQTDVQQLVHETQVFYLIDVILLTEKWEKKQLVDKEGFKKSIYKKRLKICRYLCIINLNCYFQVLQLHPELLNLPDPEKKSVDITDDMIAQVDCKK